MTALHDSPTTKKLSLASSGCAASRFCKSSPSQSMSCCMQQVHSPAESPDLDEVNHVCCHPRFTSDIIPAILHVVT